MMKERPRIPITEAKQTNDQLSLAPTVDIPTQKQHEYCTVSRTVHAPFIIYIYNKTTEGHNTQMLRQGFFVFPVVEISQIP